MSVKVFLLSSHKDSRASRLNHAIVGMYLNHSPFLLCVCIPWLILFASLFCGVFRHLNRSSCVCIYSTTNNHILYTVQTSPEQYEFPDEPYPPHIRQRKHPPCPTAAEVRTYLTDYCTARGILPYFEFGVTVRNVAKTSAANCTSSWTVTTSKGLETFCYVIVCTGLFSNQPHVLDIPGLSDFIAAGGQVLHTSTWTSPKQFMGKKVLVIGNGKSAADAAIVAAQVAKENHSTPPIQAIRKQNWYVPRFMLHFKWAFHSRTVSALLPQYFERASGIQGLLYTLLHTLASPIKFVLWRLLELVFLVLLRLPVALWPKLGTIDTEGSLSVPLLVTDDRHLQPIRNGEIDMRICQVVKVTAATAPQKQTYAHLSTGAVVPIDVIVMGTGWQLDYTFLDEVTVRRKLDFCNDGLWLYRNILAPQLEGIAFVGANTLTFMNIYTAYVQAFWLAHLLAGRRDHEPEKKMNDSIAREKVFKRRLYPNCPLRGASIEAYMQHYHDLLFAEQGIDPYVYRSSGLLAPLWNVILPILPETMAASFAKARLALKKND
jgi:dimethylaniline monooxygenase (N-oxide forming)